MEFESKQGFFVPLFRGGNPHEAGLDDVGHNYYFFSSTFYSYSMGKVEMLHEK